MAQPSEAEGSSDHRQADEPLLGLDEHYRRPLQLSYLEEKSCREIAAAIPFSLGTVMSRISRGKRLLAGAMGAERNKTVRSGKFPQTSFCHKFEVPCGITEPP